MRFSVDEAEVHSFVSHESLRPTDSASNHTLGEQDEGAEIRD